MDFISLFSAYFVNISLFVYNKQRDQQEKKTMCEQSRTEDSDLQRPENVFKYA